MKPLRILPSFRQALGLAVLAAALGAGLVAVAQADDEPDRKLLAIRAAVARGEILSLPRIMELAQASVPGDVIKTELKSDKRRLTYKVKILTSKAHVYEVKLDARTGKILEIEDD